MNSLGKWLVRGAALVILLGFILPSVTVSCTALPSAQVTMSTSEMATMDGGQPLLFLLPFGAVIALAFAFIPSNTRTMFFIFLAGQIGGLGLGLLGLLVGMFLFYNQAQQLGGVNVTPQIGLFVLILGYGVAGVGVALQVMEGLKMPSAGATAPAPAASASPPAAPVTAVPPPPETKAPTGARLEVTRGPLANKAFHIKGEVFTIGRGPGNDLQLMDKTVSRQHARIRFGQGEWFLQDQKSAAGTRVNGKGVTATRLNNGDQITIGDTTMVFRK